MLSRSSADPDSSISSRSSSSATPPPATRTGSARNTSAPVLARHHYSGRKPANELLAKLRAAPATAPGILEADARRGLVSALVTALKPIVEQIRLLTSEIAHTVRTHPDGQIFLSFFKSPDSVICAATLLAEIGDDRARYPTAEHLAADAGMTPSQSSPAKKVACFHTQAATTASGDATPTLADATRNGTHGPKTGWPPPPAPADIHPARSAPSDAPDPRPPGDAGQDGVTTPPATTASNTSPTKFPGGLDTGRPPCPTADNFWIALSLYRP